MRKSHFHFKGFKGAKIKKTPASAQAWLLRGGVSLILAVILALILILGGMQIFLSGVVATQGQKIAQLELEKGALTRVNQELQARINSVSSLSVIERRAQEELLMRQDHSAFYYLTPDYLAALFSP